MKKITREQAEMLLEGFMWHIEEKGKAIYFESDLEFSLDLMDSQFKSFLDQEQAKEDGLVISLDGHSYLTDLLQLWEIQKQELMQTASQIEVIYKEIHDYGESQKQKELDNLKK